MVDEWSPHVVKAAKAMYKRLNILKDGPRWRDLSRDSTDHYCIAAKLALDTFHYSATRAIQVEW